MSFAASASPTPAYIAPWAHPIGEQLCLLKLRGGDLSKSLLEHLSEMSAPGPAKSDWSALIAQGLVARSFSRSTRGNLALTPRGVHHVSQIMRDLAKKFGVHHVTQSHTMAPSARCTCGWSTAGQNSWNGRDAVAKAASVHLARVGQSPADRLFQCSVAPVGELRQ